MFHRVLHPPDRHRWARLLLAALLWLGFLELVLLGLVLALGAWVIAWILRWLFALLLALLTPPSPYLPVAPVLDLTPIEIVELPEEAGDPTEAEAAELLAEWEALSAPPPPETGFDRFDGVLGGFDPFEGGPDGFAEIAALHAVNVVDRGGPSDDALYDLVTIAEVVREETITPDKPKPNSLSARDDVHSQLTLLGALSSDQNQALSSLFGAGGLGDAFPTEGLGGLGTSGGGVGVSGLGTSGLVGKGEGGGGSAMGIGGLGTMGRSTRGAGEGVEGGVIGGVVGGVEGGVVGGVVGGTLSSARPKQRYMPDARWPASVPRDHDQVSCRATVQLTRGGKVESVRVSSCPDPFEAEVRRVLEASRWDVPEDWGSRPVPVTLVFVP